ncbi:MAG: ATP-binding protein [Flavobacteriaceae bacterium]|jgi:hypothetical protein|nr:ATP-binding protein [Flavobacteriaceae bacterium]
MSNTIQGSPTKTFFIEMITRDISIKDAILDLLDNSIDGANKLNPHSYNGLFIDITINENEFIVRDNCGGFSLETAQKYAFRFGRPDDTPPTEGSIGRFGIGMKRALFKIGQDFEVKTKSANDHFQINVNVTDWKERKKTITDSKGEQFEVEDWDFEYLEITDETNNLEQNGTYIKVCNLHKEVSEIFKDDEFLNDLKDEIERLLNFSIEKGIKITLNGSELQKKDIVIFNDTSKPYFYELEYNGVRIRVVAGLSFVGNPRASGWYIYCNDRLVLEADKTEITLWGTGNIPRWHVDYVMFKGIVFFDSYETIKLPLTTTKKGIDATSETYNKAKFFMREGMNLVLGFLKDVRRKLGSEANGYRTMLGEQEDKISVINLKTAEIEEGRKFIYPEINLDVVASKNEEVRIAFTASKKLADKLRSDTDSKTYKELGEYLLRYYLKMEEVEYE